MEMKITTKEVLFVVVLAGLVVLAVASLFAPLTEGDRAEMLIDGTSGLPQDR